MTVRIETPERAGEPLGDGWFRVEKDLFLERQATEDTVEFELAGSSYTLDVPENAGDVTFVAVVDGLPRDAPPLTVVLLRPRSWRATLRSLFAGGGAPSVTEHEGEVRRVTVPPATADG